MSYLASGFTRFFSPSYDDDLIILGVAQLCD